MTDTFVQDRDDIAPSQQLSRVDEPMQRKRVGDMAVDRFAGLTFAEYRECVEFAKLMSQAKHSVPGYLKGNAGDCLAIVTQALRWHLEPYWVAQHSYIAKAESLIAYDAAVHTAIVLSSGLLRQRLRYVYSDDALNGPSGEELTCTVIGHFAGEETAVSLTTPPLRQCRPPRNQDGVVKGSPLWDKDPKQQLAYYGSRAWGRRYCPDLLGGVYDREEFEETTQDETDVVPPSPNLMARLPGKMEGAGFQENVVDKGIATEAAAQEEQSKAEKKARRATGEAAGEASAVATQEATPQPESGKPEPFQEPQTADAYMAYCPRWIEKGADPDYLEARWDGEKEMRANLKVPVAMRKRLQAMLEEKIDQLRKPKKGKR